MAFYILNQPDQIANVENPFRQQNIKIIDCQTFVTSKPLTENPAQASKKYSRRIRFKTSQHKSPPKEQLFIVTDQQAQLNPESEHRDRPSPFLPQRLSKKYSFLDDASLYISNKSQSKLLEEQEKKNRRRISNRMQPLEKSQPKGEFSRRLEPISNNFEVKQLDVVEESGRGKITSKNNRLTKQLFNIRKKMRKTNIKILIPSDREAYYRLGEQQSLCNVFNIQSFQEPFNLLLEKNCVSLIKDNRRTTQPNLNNQDSIQKRQIRNYSLFSNLDTETFEGTKMALTQQRKCVKVRKQYRLKEVRSPPVNRIKLSRQFRQPFETYCYRDFLWKVNYSNGLYVQPPLEYEHRLKAFVGKGNNSCMVRGLIGRRYWFAFTDKVDEANFVWVQLKHLNFYDFQQSSQLSLQEIHKDKRYYDKNIFSQHDLEEFKKYWQAHMRGEENSDERLLVRSKHFKYHKSVGVDEIKASKMQNHLKNNYVIGNKKTLFKTMCQYYQSNNLDPFDFIPLTFHIVEGREDPQFLAFQKYYHRRGKDINKAGEKSLNMWIVKPGENSNRGNGIKVCHTLNDIKQILKNKERWPDGTAKTYIIQSYIQNPLLYKKRKFDLRHYIVVTCINGLIKGYWFADGYVRTTSSEYKLGVSSGAVHLTNDAVQKQLPDYGKYEKGNKLSYEQLDEYIQRIKSGKSFFRDIYPQLKKMGTDIIRASASYLDQERLENNFQVFGLDFMIDSSLRPWLIEVNSNPCLELGCPVLSQIIPNLIESVLEITLDTIFPPPVRYSPKFPRYLNGTQEANKLQLVFDERIERGFTGDGQIIDNRMLAEEDDVFEDDGSQWDET